MKDNYIAYGSLSYLTAREYADIYHKAYDNGMTPIAQDKMFRKMIAEAVSARRKEIGLE